jgi:N-acetylglucosaminyldiphosphoundecaprenol N-acetyl-beta-D-mannosaminyltransferase
VEYRTPRINVLGVGISAINLDVAISKIAEWIDNRECQYVNVCTVHTIMECYQNPALRKIINSSGLATPDGMPLMWLCRYYGFKKASRVYGPDLMLDLCEYSVPKGYRHLFYGGNEGVADQLSTVLKNRYPGLQIAGSYSPPYRDVGYIEETSFIERINNTSPDIIWVGLGTPKQDFWVAQHRQQLKAPVLIAVGAAFDFHTGRVRQAPKWLQQSGLEWLFRLSMEPRRLAYRYLKYNPLFVILIVLQLMRLRRYPIER